MTLAELKEALEGYDDTLEVRIRIADSEENNEVEPGDYLEITDERNVTVEYGKLIVIGDALEEEL